MNTWHNLAKVVQRTSWIKSSKVLIIALLICFINVIPATAFPDDYSPKSKELGRPVPLAKLEKNKNGQYKADEISITPEGMESTEPEPIYHFSYRGKKLFDLNKDSEYPYLGDMWTADLDGNGLKDIAIYASHMGNGIAPDNGIILFQSAPRVFQRLDVESLGFGPENFTDLDMDGKPEVILCSLNNRMGQRHSFFTYTVYMIRNFSLERAEYGKAGFPKTIWFGAKPSNTVRLTDKQKRSYNQDLPEKISSVVATGVAAQSG